MAAMSQELAVADVHRVEQLRSLSARRPNKALVRIDAQVRHYNALARREAEHRALSERRQRRVEEINGDKERYRREKAKSATEREAQVRQMQVTKARHLENKMANHYDKFEGKEDKRAKMFAEQTARLQATSREHRERTEANLSRARSADLHRRQMTARRHEEEEQRLQRLQEELKTARGRAQQLKQAREAQAAANVAQQRDRVNRVIAMKEAAYYEKLGRVDMKLAMQHEAHKDIQQHNASMDAKIALLDELTQRQILLGGSSQQLQADIDALRGELERMALVVPGAAVAGRTVNPAATGLPKYLTNVHRPGELPGGVYSPDRRVPPSPSTPSTPVTAGRATPKKDLGAASPATSSTAAPGSPAAALGDSGHFGRTLPGHAA